MTATEARKLTEDAIKTRDSIVGEAIAKIERIVAEAAAKGYTETAFPSLRSSVFQGDLRLKTLVCQSLINQGFRIYSVQTGINEDTEYIAW